MASQPGSVLFCCTQNSIRSPMAEALLKYLPRQAHLRGIRSVCGPASRRLRHRGDGRDRHRPHQAQVQDVRAS